MATGHAMRMGMELGVHRALSILRSRMAAPPSAFDAHEERLLVVSARVWLALYIQDHSFVFRLLPLRTLLTRRRQHESRHRETHDAP